MAVLHFEISLRCRCGHQFRARVDAQTPPEPTARYEVYCPMNGSLLIFPAMGLCSASKSDPKHPEAHIEGSRYRFFREQRDKLFATHQDWQTSDDFDQMLDYLWERVSIRKLRLLACAFCRRVWNAMTDERSRSAVAIAERLADGFADMSAVRRAEIEARKAWDDAIAAERRCHAAASAWVALAATDWNAKWDIGDGPTKAVSWAASNALGAEGRDERETQEKATQADLLRDVIGPLPLGSVGVNSSWVTTNVLALAKGIYDDRAFDRMPILADALADAGCTNETVLVHCRGPGPHVRGCWVVDLLLGKE